MVDRLRKEKEDNKLNMSLYKSVIPSFWILHSCLAYLSQKTKGTKRIHSKRPKCISRGMRIEGRRQTLHQVSRNSPMRNSSSNWNEQQKLPHRDISLHSSGRPKNQAGQRQSWIWRTEETCTELYVTAQPKVNSFTVTPLLGRIMGMVSAAGVQMCTLCTQMLVGHGWQLDCLGHKTLLTNYQD